MSWMMLLYLPLAIYRDELPATAFSAQPPAGSIMPKNTTATRRQHFTDLRDDALLVPAY